MAPAPGEAPGEAPALKEMLSREMLNELKRRGEESTEPPDTLGGVKKRKFGGEKRESFCVGKKRKVLWERDKVLVGKKESFVGKQLKQFSGEKRKFWWKKRKVLVGKRERFCGEENVLVEKEKV